MRPSSPERVSSPRRDVPGLLASPAASHRRYLAMAALLISVVFIVLSVRLFGIQVLRHDEYAARVDRMLTGVDSVRGSRGTILTAGSTKLAVDIPRYTLAMDPERIPAEYHRHVIDFVCEELGLPDVQRRNKHARLSRSQELARQGRIRPLEYLVLGRDLEIEQAREVIERLRESVLSLGGSRGASEGELRRLLPRFGVGRRGGMCLEEAHFRLYPRGAFCAHVLGSVSPGERGGDLRGLEGIERTMNAYLEGWDGHREVHRDGMGDTRLYSADNIDIAPIDGYNVHLTIDGRIQGIVEEELREGVQEKRADAGTAIVMDCRTGDILALASWPEFDPGRFHDYPWEEFKERRRNRAVERIFEPGSTIKPLIAAIALELGLVRQDEPIWSGGRSTRLLGRRVSDVSDHGPMNFEEVVIHSSNIGMAIVGLRLGRDGLNEVLDRFRIATPTEIPLPGELRGKRTALADWSEKYSSISVSFGFEVSLTPIQLAAAYCSLVNGGHYVLPRLVDRIERDQEVHRFPVRRVHRTVSEATSRVMRGILHEVIERGTGRAHRIPGLPYGGKTGTAAISQGRRGYSADGRKEYLSSLVAFAPYREDRWPDVVVLVMVERPEPRLGYYGSVVCGPVVKAILERMYRVPDGGGAGAPHPAEVPGYELHREGGTAATGEELIVRER